MNRHQRGHTGFFKLAAVSFAFSICAVGAALRRIEPDTLARKAEDSLRRRHYRRARRLFGLLTCRAPHDRRGYEGAAEALLRLGRADLAFAVLLKGTERISKQA